MMYPFGFFAGGVVPYVATGASSVPALMLSCSATFANYVMLTLGGVGIDTSTFVVTISGLTMGGVTKGTVDGVSVRTSTDSVQSVGVPSGEIVY